MPRETTEIADLAVIVPPLLTLGLISNLAALVSPIYMMQVLDRVLASGNLTTLAMLAIVAFGALGIAAFAEFVRDRILSRAVGWVEAVFAPRSWATPDGPLRVERLTATAELRGFLKSGAAGALNLPFVPVFLFALFLLHPALLVLPLVAAISFPLLDVAGRATARLHTESAASHRARANTLAEILASAGALARTMAIGPQLIGRQLDAQDAARQREDRSGRTNAVVGAIRNFLRTGLQISALSIGAILVVSGELSAGGMIAASLLAAKANAGIEGAVGGLRGLGLLRCALPVLAGADAGVGKDAGGTSVGAFSGALTATGLIVPRGQGMPPRLERINLALEPGTCLAGVGPTGSGKSTLLAALSGLDPAPIGVAALDGIDLRAMAAVDRNRVIGILEQGANLPPAPISEIICRFDPAAEDADIVAAARIAGVHGLISALPAAYATDLGRTPWAVSAGQRQRIALARAVFGGPRYLFLDEPNALLDAAGERQLCDALSRLKTAGTTIVMTIHRAGIIGLADTVLALDAGRMTDFGPRAEVMGRMGDGRRELSLPVNAAALQDLADWTTRQFTRESDAGLRERAVMVATELYNFACANGPTSAARKLTLSFRFLDDSACEIALSEARRSHVGKKVERIRARVSRDAFDLSDLADDELALAMVLRLTEGFDISAQPRRTTMSARLPVHTGRQRPMVLQ